MSVPEAIASFSGRLGRELPEDNCLSSSPSDSVRRRVLFGEYARMWNKAEAAGDQESMGKLLELRARLRHKVPTSQGSLALLSMITRIVLASLVLTWGGFVIILLAPLRLLHPTLRTWGLKNGQLPLDIVVTTVFCAVLAAMGIRVSLQEGSIESCWGDNPCGIIAYNHASNLDPFIVNVICAGVAPKYIGKKSLFKLPIFGWLCFVVGMVPINRGNHEKALQTMNKTVAGIMKRWGRCVCISPEGTRSTDGNLKLPFKKGLFHLQTQTNAPLLPVVIHGAYDLWPPSQLFTSTGEVKVSILPSQPPQSKSDENGHNRARIALQETIATQLEQSASISAKPLGMRATAELAGILLITLTAMIQSTRLYHWTLSFLGLTTPGLLLIMVVMTGFIALLVEQLA